MAEAWGTRDDLDELYRRAVQGDRRALGALTRRVEPQLRAAIHRALGRCRHPPAEVDDYVAAVWLHLIEDDCSRLRRFQPSHGARFTTWLHIVARNLVRSSLRRRMDLLLDDPAALPERSAATAPSPERACLTLEEIGLLGQAVARLSPADQALYQALIVDERPAAEVARELGIRPTALYVRRHRMVNRLRAALDALRAEGRRSASPRGAGRG